MHTAIYFTEVTRIYIYILIYMLDKLIVIIL